MVLVSVLKNVERYPAWNAKAHWLCISVHCGHVLEKGPSLFKNRFTGSCESIFDSFLIHTIERQRLALQQKKIKNDKKTCCNQVNTILWLPGPSTSCGAVQHNSGPGAWVPVRVRELLLAAVAADGSFLWGMPSSRLCRLRKLPVRLLRRLSFLGLSLAGRPTRLTWAGESAAVSPLV